MIPAIGFCIHLRRLRQEQRTLKSMPERLAIMIATGIVQKFLNYLGKWLSGAVQVIIQKLLVIKMTDELKLVFTRLAFMMVQSLSLLAML